MRGIVFGMLLALGLAAAGLTNAHAQQPLDSQLGAFGLRFGESLEQARQKGLVASFDERRGSMQVYKAARLPNQPSNTDLVSLAFIDGAGLQVINWTSKNIEGDISGREGKAAYAALKSTLEKKYGPPQDNLEVSGLELYDENDEFYQCLDYSGCGMWVSIWQGDFGAVSLEIESAGQRGTGWLLVRYEGPLYKEASDRDKARTQQRDADAF